MKPPNYTNGLREAEERLRIAGELSSARTGADIALILNALNYYRSLAASQKSAGQKAFETRPYAWAGSGRSWDELPQFYRDAWETHATGTRKRYGMEGP